MSDQAQVAATFPTGRAGLAAFLPQDRRTALALGSALPDRTQGAALFADLSGFTALTESLARTQGPLRGAETLSQVLRSVFEVLIGEIEAYGGSVIGFGGDAVTCWFDADDGSTAVHAGFAMQRAMATLSEASSELGEARGLRLKVAVAVGAVGRYVVGDPEIQQIDIIAGRTLDVLATAEHATKPGEVVLALNGEPPVEVRELRQDGGAELELAVLAPRAGAAPGVSHGNPAALSEAAASSWVLSSVRRPLHEGMATFLAGFRPAAALFLSFGGIEYDLDPEAGTKLDTFVRWAQGVVDAHGGSLIQLTTGDKGSYLYAAFGAPVAHEDDAARAVMAARVLVGDTAEGIGDRRAGLTYGSMFTGTYGSRSRCTYGVLGPMTNLAARLMTLARPGEILCSSEIARLASRRYRMEARGSHAVKGVVEPVPVFAPVGVTSGGSTEIGEILGRTREFDQLVSELDEAKRGVSRVALIEGDAGLGKSALLAAMGVEAERRGMVVLKGIVSAAGPEEPYGIWRGIVAGALGLTPGIPSRAVLSAALSGLDPALAEYAAALGDLFGANIAGGAESDGVLRRQAVAAAVALVLEARTRRGPLALLLDDVHRVDALSFELFQAVSDRLRRDRAGVAFLLARRAVPAEQELEASTRIELGPLDDDTLDRLAAAWLGVRVAALPARLRELMRERCAGHPFVAEGLVRHLQSEGLLRVQVLAGARTCELTGTAQQLAAVPDTVQGLLLSQIDRLVPRSQLTLKVAATVGRQFMVPAVAWAFAVASDLPESAVRPAMKDLTERGFVDALADDEAYRFRQPIVQEVAYSTLLFAQRRELHGALVGWFKSRAAGDVAAIAHHAYHAALGTADEGRIRQAADAQLSFAQQLTDLGSYPGAADVVRRGLELLPEGPRWASRRADLLVLNGVLMQHLSRYGEAHEHLSLGLEMGRQSGAQDTVARALDGLCLVATRRGAFEEARAFAERGLEHALDTANRAAEARSRSRLGILAAYGGDFDAAAEHYHDAIALADELSDRSALASNLSNLGLVRVYQQRYESARDAFRRALRLAEALESRHLRARFLTNLGLVDEYMGDLDAAEDHYRAGLALFEDLGARQEAIVNVLNLGELSVRRERFEEARAAYRRALSGALGVGALPVALGAVVGLALVAVREGDPRTAAELLGTVHAHPARQAEVEQHADIVMGEVRALLDGVSLEQALGNGRATSLEDVARRMASVER